jgi:hypothetical protein
MRALRSVSLAFAAAIACDGTGAEPGPKPGDLVLGTWGGTDAGLIATDSSAHLHIGCTLGNVAGPITLDAEGRFDVPALYNITAYPVDRGIVHPARVTGVVVGRYLRLTVQLTDTAVTLGPVRLRLGAEPGMVMCPICRRPP